MALRDWHGAVASFGAVGSDAATIDDDDEPRSSWMQRLLARARSSSSSKDEGGKWHQWTSNVPLCGGALLLWLAVAFAFRSVYDAAEQSDRVPATARWATFRDFAQTTPRCAPLAADNASSDSFPLRVGGPRYNVDSYAKLVDLVSAPDDDDDWAARIHCAEFRTGGGAAAAGDDDDDDDATTPLPACACLLRTDSVKLVLCSPSVVAFAKTGAVEVWDNWFEAMQQAYVPAEITLRDHCNKGDLVLRHDTAYLGGGGMQFLGREPNPRGLFPGA